MEAKILEVGGVIGGLFIVWKILQVVLDYRKNVKQPIAPNGQAGKIIEILNELRLQGQKQLDAFDRISTAQAEHSASLGTIMTTLSVQTEQHKRLLDEVRERNPLRRKRR